MNTILGQLRPHTGEVFVKQNEIAYCPDVPSFEPFLTPQEVLEQTLQLNGKKVSDFKDKIDNVLVSVDLKRHSKKLSGGFSRGMKQRLGIASALILEPKLIFLDEPTSALDPFGQLDILNLVERISSERVVVISSHNLKDIEKIASELIVLNKGKLIYNGSLNQFIEKDEEYMYIELKDKQATENLFNTMRHKDMACSLYDDLYIKVKVSELSEVFMVISEFTESLQTITRSKITLDEAFSEQVNKLNNS
ncbi:ATP-binding cassette domain-containing protein [Staphylococcus pseudoxylosus]|uniref:ABC transporter ATP-binding protein n=1 Tax=Staphylococcus pseudoxylosus TaxID=2282419 RepID=A0AAQ0MH77_9STAP|nr:ABC transporter ATP-binding protein [Staphylococcus pseudoxylosus]MBM2659147.1 ABC transporter ATP-binding protein [Staphylococcus pseudoxylosus]MCE5002443.1 ABC transporter ATP-binding protein [Staphylococcus pseudoxylosus]MDW8545495.1 ABC transporter ATP-binding protein [Staphylococcus pseudoxylosus]RMI85444.1 ABC transporter ATP-binding protein [Staphylococcus pseudoxylosus]